MILKWIKQLLENRPDDSSTIVLRKGGHQRSNLACGYKRFCLELRELEDRMVPSTFYVDPSFTQSAGTMVTFNPGLASQVNNLTIGTNAFATITSAVASASAGDTIELAAKTFTLTPGIILDKSLNLVGSGENSTILNPNASATFLSGDPYFFNVNTAGTTVNFSNFTFDGLAGTYSIGVGINYSTGANGSLQNMTFQNISGIAVDYGSNLDVVGSTFQNIYTAISTITGASGSNLTVENSSFTGPGMTNNIGFSPGIQINNNNATATISGATFANFVTLEMVNGLITGSEAILIGNASSVTITGSTFQTNYDGVVNGMSGTTQIPTVNIHYNNFFSNSDAAIVDASNGNIQAQNNYFGSPTGPTYTIQNLGGTGDKIINHRYNTAGITNILDANGSGAIQFSASEFPLGYSGPPSSPGSSGNSTPPTSTSGTSYSSQAIWPAYLDAFYTYVYSLQAFQMGKGSLLAFEYNSLALQEIKMAYQYAQQGNQSQTIYYANVADFYGQVAENYALNDYHLTGNSLSALAYIYDYVGNQLNQKVLQGQ